MFYPLQVPMLSIPKILEWDTEEYRINCAFCQFHYPTKLILVPGVSAGTCFELSPPTPFYPHKRRVRFSEERAAMVAFVCDRCLGRATITLKWIFKTQGVCVEYFTRPLLDLQVWHWQPVTPETDYTSVCFFRNSGLEKYFRTLACSLQNMNSASRPGMKSIT